MHLRMQELRSELQEAVKQKLEAEAQARDLDRARESGKAKSIASISTIVSKYDPENRPLRQVTLLGRGASGEVHQVRFLPMFPSKDIDCK